MTAALSVLSAASLPAQAPLPVGQQFQINSYTTSWQGSPAVAMDSRSQFVVVWSSDGSQGTDTSSYSIQGRRYDANGSEIGAQFQVNSYSSYDQYSPRVSTDRSGSFVIVWASYGPDNNGGGIRGQRFDSAGTPLNSEFPVNSFTLGHQNQPVIASDPDGDFVIVWQSEGSAGPDQSGWSIQGQRFDASGTPVGGEFQVNSFTSGDQLAPSVAMDPLGNFVVVWQSDGSSGSDTDAQSIHGQRFTADGDLTGFEFQVNSYTSGSQGSPTVATDPNGNFVVIWDSYGSDGSDTDLESIQGQRFDGAGESVGEQFQVNTCTTAWQMYPSVAAGADGGFTVVWSSLQQDGSLIGTFGQSYRPDGSSLEGEFPVNSYTLNSQYFPGIAIGPDGRLITVWESVGSPGSDSSNTSIQGQRFSTGALFTDGFESGDTGAWSNSTL